MTSAILIPFLVLSTTWYQVNFFDDTWEEKPASQCLMIMGSKVLANNAPDLMMRERTKTALKAITDDTQTIIVTGGSLDDRMTESEVAKGILVEGGIDPERIETEQRSTSTYQNLLYSQHIVEENNCDQVDFVSHGFHLARIRFTAKRLGYPIGRLIDAELNREISPQLLQREYAAYIIYWLGWSLLQE